MGIQCPLHTQENGEREREQPKFLHFSEACWRQPFIPTSRLQTEWRGQDSLTLRQGKGKGSLCNTMFQAPSENFKALTVTRHISVTMQSTATRHLHTLNWAKLSRESCLREPLSLSITHLPRHKSVGLGNNVTELQQTSP